MSRTPTGGTWGRKGVLCELLELQHAAFEFEAPARVVAGSDLLLVGETGRDLRPGDLDLEGRSAERLGDGGDLS